MKSISIPIEQKIIAGIEPFTLLSWRVTPTIPQIRVTIFMKVVITVS